MTSCYPGTDGGASYVALTTAAGRRITVLGQAQVLENAHLAEAGNAALALRTLGGNGDLVWYLPDPLELSTSKDAPTLGDLLPRGLGWAVLQLLVAAVVAMWWRGRRFGKLVREPLPVVVRAAETHEGRARLYRQAHARGRVAAILRTAAVRRVAARLGVAPGTSPEQVATLIAAMSDQPPNAVHATLLGPVPPDDGALVRLASELDAIERSVASTATTRKVQHP